MEGIMVIIGVGATAIVGIGVIIGDKVGKKVGITDGMFVGIGWVEGSTVIAGLGVAKLIVRLSPKPRETV